MDAQGPSHTALGAALLRAAHLVLDDASRVFVDTLALSLCGAREPSRLQTMLGELHHEAAQLVGPAHALTVVRAVQAAVLVRSRYTEECVEAALTQGVTQYVILGAGLDTFAYRRPELLDRLRVFEVDHPAMQQWKRDRLREIEIAIPAALTFVPVDFEHQSLMAALQAGGYRVDERAAFSCLGVSQYLQAAALQSTVTQLATAAPGSFLILGYLVPEALLDAENRRVRTFLNGLTATRGEPIVTDFVPAVLSRLLESVGFTCVGDLGAEGELAHYLAGRTDGLRHPQTHRLVHAWVGNSYRES